MKTPGEDDILGSNKDIQPILHGWDYEPGSINVRKIRGADGAPKLQMRLDLGLLQMELIGRPDGQRPHGFESLLEYFQSQLDEHATTNGTELGFHLTRRQCAMLREEAGMYYHRYLGLFVLEEFDNVVRDTARNLRVLDLCSKYAVNKQDQLILEQYRPYITMMNARAKASIEYRAGNLKDALRTVQRGLKRIKAFFIKFGQEDVYAESHEVRALKRFAREIKKKLPADPVKQLQLKLSRAIKDERYELAAELRDQIEQMQSKH
ncbi:UvrB/UvrC motif-containing protein [soil metagenome]